MGHGQQSGGMPFIFGPFPFPTHQQQQPNHRPEPREQIPARVTVAFSVLEHLTRKTDMEVAIWESGNERHNPKPLTVEEENLQATAANLIARFLEGTMKPTKEEEQHRKRLSSPAAGPGRIIGCVGCGGQGTSPDDERQPCVLCGGSRFTLITPVNEP